ncbi:MAG: hypothetical protein LBR72_09155 [Oscillospiraceae bacterium]|jgi:hypothetical protein|nr:hypothetical protein [Oscillospiraceae bacterium]
MLELYARLKPNFSNADKEGCKPLIYRFLDMCKTARLKGLLTLDLEMELEEDFFLYTAVGMVIDGVAPQTVRSVLEALILSGKYSGSALLRRLLIAEGALSMQQQDTPRMTILRMCALLGESFADRMIEELFSGKTSRAAFTLFLRGIQEQRVLSECVPFENVLANLDGRSIQAVLRGVPDAVLLEALRGCSYGLIRKVLENISLNTGYWIAENWETYQGTRREPIYTCQEEIIEKALRMEERGELLGVLRLWKAEEEVLPDDYV